AEAGPFSRYGGGGRGGSTRTRRRRTMRGTTFRGLMAAALLAGSLTSCSLLRSDPHEGAQAELNRQRRQWRAQEIEDYSYTVRRLCFCPETFTAPVRVRVEGGEVAS